MFLGGFMGVSTYNHNNSGDKNCQNRDVLYHALMAVLLMSNGMSVVGCVCCWQSLWQFGKTMIMRLLTV